MFHLYNNLKQDYTQFFFSHIFDKSSKFIILIPFYERLNSEEVKLLMI
jgi:hypothetical protein